jgi:hypothetical protein
LSRETRSASKENPESTILQYDLQQWVPGLNIEQNTINEVYKEQEDLPVPQKIIIRLVYDSK